MEIDMTTKAQTITLSAETLEKLSTAVTLPDAKAVNDFVADAINTYVQLGQLYQSGGEFHFIPEGRDGPVRLHFPFQPDPRQTSNE
jgi:hypothetical protein